MVGRVAFAMVLGPGEIDSNIVSCNAFVFIELLEAHFFTHNDWVESSFQFIVLFDWFSFLYSFIFSFIRHYCFIPLMLPFFFSSSFMVA